jgi:ParB family chromosome partitioning protein
MDAISRILNKSKQEDTLDQVQRVQVDLLQPNPFQPRKQFDQIQMEELSRSIAEMGVIQPIVIRQVEDRYEIVAGERRWRAAGMAGQTTIPALIRNYSDREMAEIALVENLQRADLGYFEEAEGYRKLIEDFQLTQEEIAARVGKSQPTIANKLRIMKIDPFVKENIMAELLTERHVRALLRLKTPDDQMLILKEIYENDLNVKETERMIAEFLDGRYTNKNEGKTAMEEDEPEKKKQTVKRILSDMRIYINTIKAAVASIQDSGMEVRMEQVETEEGIQVIITLPRTKTVS